MNVSVKRFWILIGSIVALTLAPAARSTSVSASADYYNRILQGTTSDSDLVNVGDMQIRAGVVRAWRDKLGGISKKSATPNTSSPSGLVKWTGGKVYYVFDSAVTSAHRRQFLDAAAEWGTFANVQFLQRTTQTKYMLVQNSANAGGQSAVGMVGPAQLFLIGSWNRGTLLHELGHTLGLIHEHQRSDRDTYVNILTANVIGGATNGNFTLIPDSTNGGPYDFYSIMHYARNALSLNPATLNTIEPKPSYSAYLNIYGQQSDRPLSPGDRSNMAVLYGAGPVLTSVVTNTKDSGPGSLRAALYYAFDNPGTTITFNIPATDPNFNGKYFLIRPTGGLFAPGDNTIVDGSSQPGNTNPTGPEIEIVGNLMTHPEFYVSGIKLRGTNVTIRGLAFSKFPEFGIHITGAGANRNTVAGCHVGINATGDSASPNAYDDIAIDNGAHDNTIGGTAVADRNVISGSISRGIYLYGPGTTGNKIIGNFIGTRSNGSTRLANAFSGIEIQNASGNTVGGTATGTRNIISGNSSQGIVIDGIGSTGNTVAGNFIGLASNGLTALPNSFSGVQLSGGASGNTIGGDTSASRNVISGNTYQGIVINDSGTSGNTIGANYIGLNYNATGVIGNQGSGIDVRGSATHNTIGGTVSGWRNYICGNKYQGIGISGTGTSGNIVAGNYIGIGTNGTTPRPNNVGVEIFGGATGNTIGGLVANARNIISGNNYRGIGISGTGTKNNTVSHNYIGLNLSGNGATPNIGAGIAIFGGATGNVVGGISSTARNIISGNTNQGITISDAGTNLNTVEFNYIGVNSAGTAALPNGWSGVDIFGGAQNNNIGYVGAPNVISGNGNYGISISGTNTMKNYIRNNIVGLNAASNSTLGNAWSGLALFSGASGNNIGGSKTGEGNLISGNGLRGIDIFDSSSVGNRIWLNSIYGNSQLAINLAGGSEDGFGVTANDPGDADAGPNGLQNFPILTAVISNAFGTTVTGSLNSAPNKTFRVECFYGAAEDASQHGGCKTYFGSFNLGTNASGNGAINIKFASILPPGSIFAATATSPTGDTSEFAQNVVVTSAP